MDYEKKKKGYRKEVLIIDLHSLENNQDGFRYVWFLFQF